MVFYAETFALFDRLLPCFIFAAGRRFAGAVAKSGFCAYLDHGRFTGNVEIRYIMCYTSIKGGDYIG